ncbi:Uroporphyrinogen decarboxylase HemE [Cynara cardunculus var. scolymus]|uniref:uroporphyrinogen decarboxylase n=1 Tax=Cynara cardunculus var. scolymus TaxID=59895 RepID=A0A103YL46_CYNCS|nr:Uroporphyrinogen decarboxylase HemE [Cynara cardunculus var. scolymus]
MGFSSFNSGCGCCSLGWKSSSFLVPLGFNSSTTNGVLVSSSINRFNRFRAVRPSASASSPSSGIVLPQFVACDEPLLVKAARGDPVSRPPAWMMRQAGRYMAVYRKLAEKHPSFRERSETTDLIVEISLQPWEAFHPDGVIIFSDILTPLPAFGVPFDIEEVRGPVIQTPIRSEEGLKALHPINLDKLNFVGESLKILRQEVDGRAAVLGFVGAPWTIATYIVEGGTTRTYTNIKSMCHTAPHVLRALLSHLTEAIAEYVVYQVKCGAHCVQIFDSWGGQLPPNMWELWSKPYINEAKSQLYSLFFFSMNTRRIIIKIPSILYFQIVGIVKKKCPEIPLVLYINGNGGLLEKMKGTGVDVIGLDWTVDMADGRRRVVKCAGPRGHILNLGHGVLVGTPEEAVSRFFDVARSFNFDSVEEKPKVVV